MSLPWFENHQFPIYLAPMAGVTDITFRQICKELGADVLVTEFVSAEGILRQDARTKKYTEFGDDQHPIGIQLFGADGTRMGEAANKIIDWKKPDFIDINFGCPVKKVVSKNGGSSLLRDCALVHQVAADIVKAVNGQVPVTAKIRIGWDENSINAIEVCKQLVDAGIEAIAIHGRTRAQSYSGLANWDIINECAQAIPVPIIGNGDIHNGQDIERIKKTSNVSGVMIGRAAMQYPWVFKEAKHYLATGEHLEPPTIEERWEFILRHCELAIESNRYGSERQTLTSMRSRLMIYCKSFPHAKPLRAKLSQLDSLEAVRQLSEDYINYKPSQEELKAEAES